MNTPLLSRPYALPGDSIHALATELHPLCRSVSGPGTRRILDVIDREIGLIRTDVPSGSAALDWLVPPEWSVREAWIRDDGGTTVADLADGTLSVVDRSPAVRGRMPLSELRAHVFTLPDQPGRIPRRAAVGGGSWGICMRHRDFERMADGGYEVLIASEDRPGRMSYGEHLIRGRTGREFLLSAHVGPSSLADDNSSAVAVMVELARTLSGRTLRHTYRFLFGPPTIGAVAWLARNEEAARRVDHGLVVSCLGGGMPSYMSSRRGEAEIDRAMRQVLTEAGLPERVRPFEPFGGDERQFCSPGYDLPVGRFERGDAVPGHHPSGDDLRPEHLAEHLGASHDMILEAIEIIEGDWTPLNLSPKGEPDLERRGLASGLGAGSSEPGTRAMLWVLNLADGWHSLLDIAERSRLGFRAVARAADRLAGAGLLADAEARDRRGGSEG